MQAYNKAIMAVLGGVATVATQRWGVQIDPAIISSAGGLLTALLVYFVPNR